jgi:hypothetical protein
MKEELILYMKETLIDKMIFDGLFEFKKKIGKENFRALTRNE